MAKPEATFDGTVSTIGKYKNRAPGMLIQIRPNGDLERFTEIVSQLAVGQEVRIHMVLIGNSE